MANDIISNAILEIYNVIPDEVLSELFAQDDNEADRLTTLDYQLVRLFNRTAIKDIRLSSGKTVYVEIDRCKNELLEKGQTLITVPKELIDGSTITSAKAIFPDTYTSGNGTSGPYSVSALYTTQRVRSPIMQSASKVFNANDGLSIQQTAKVSVVDRNKVLMHAVMYNLSLMILECDIMLTDKLKEIGLPYYSDFAELCIEAVRREIYKSLKIRLDKGKLYYGHELGVIMDYVNDCSDASDKYKELRDTWPLIVNLNDDELNSNLLKAGFPYVL